MDLYIYPYDCVHMGVKEQPVGLSFHHLGPQTWQKVLSLALTSDY